MQTENGMGKENYLYIIKNNLEKGKLCSSQQGISKVSARYHGAVMEKTMVKTADMCYDIADFKSICSQFSDKSNRSKQI